MTTGEKRSLSSSFKKGKGNFINKHSDLVSIFQTKNNLIEEFYSFWLDYSISSKLAWCKNTEYHLQGDFKSEMTARIKELFEEELETFVEKELISVSAIVVDIITPVIKFPTLKSKKKRIRKKHEKKIQKMLQKLEV